MVKAYQLAAVNTHKLGLSLGDGQQRAAFLLCDFGVEFQDVMGWLQKLPDGADLTDPKVQAWEDHLHNTITYYKPHLCDQPKNLGIYSNLNSARISDRRRYGIDGRGDHITFLIHDHWTALADTIKISSLSVTWSNTVQEIVNWVIGEIDKLACLSRAI